ncbi:rhomboid family intramembrane serine protease [Paenibacillus sp. BSR1-1]|uniref:rhomboid family intramembrane serine protease n=1 Tax=Paenibacillus sp. BSR1-1 TaxID=3020845 RepID=UPI0025B0E9C4|nr:rhomboid family intramembrane serine protease [Paenibacillus sp. BSR1-1]MDN3018526.1 rhomboid family intramembrane serine protease [Paenibacillus sp. BSR1-1]
MNNKEGYIFWKLAYALIADHGYRIIQLFENQKELWLEKLENKHAPIIRVLLHDLAWSNAMQRDIEFTAMNGERVRKQIGRHELLVVNIYVSQYPPVDEYQYRLSTPYVNSDANKTTVRSILLAMNEYDSGFREISTLLQKDVQFPINDEITELEVDMLKKTALGLAVQKVNSEKALFMQGKPIITYLLLIMQIAVFLWLQLNGGSTNTATLIKYGAKMNQLIYEGEWWRFITPVFLHIGFVHLAMNSLALYFLGTTVERIFGNVRFLLIYLFAGVTGVIASFIFSYNLSAGASGAIFGCFGALLYFGVIYPKLFLRTMGFNIIFVLAINLIFGFSSSGIDNAGHLGGLFGGFLAAGILHLPKKRKIGLQIFIFIISAIILWGSLYYGFSNSSRAIGEKSAISMAQEYIHQEKYDQAYDTLKNFEETGVNPSEKLYLILSFVEYKEKLYPDAKNHLQTVVKLEPNTAAAYYYLALVNLNENDIKEAKTNAEKALKLEPDNQDFAKLVQFIKENGGQ